MAGQAMRHELIAYEATSAHLWGATTGLRLVWAVKADKWAQDSCLVAAGRLQGAVAVSLVAVGFACATFTPVSISQQNVELWYNHLVLWV